MPKRAAAASPEERDLNRLRRLLSGTIGDLESARREGAFLRSSPAGGKKPPPGGEEPRECYDLKKIDACVDVLSKCDQLRRELYDLPTPREVQEAEKERRRRQKEEQERGPCYVVLSPVGEEETDCPEVDV